MDMHRSQHKHISSTGLSGRRLNNKTHTAVNVTKTDNQGCTEMKEKEQLMKGVHLPCRSESSWNLTPHCCFSMFCLLFWPLMR